MSASSNERRMAVDLHRVKDLLMGIVEGLQKPDIDRVGLSRFSQEAYSRMRWVTGVIPLPQDEFDGDGHETANLTMDSDSPQNVARAKADWQKGDGFDTEEEARLGQSEIGKFSTFERRR